MESSTEEKVCIEIKLQSPETVILIGHSKKQEFFTKSA